MTPAARRLGAPRAVRVCAGVGGRPLEVEGSEISAVRESWLVEDSWWSEQPLRRRYWELVTIEGGDVVVFRDLVGGGWFRHR